MSTMYEQDEETRKGICCPQCGCNDTSVYYVRPRVFIIRGKDPEGGNLRCRQCNHCGKRFTTREEVQGG